MQWCSMTTNLGSSLQGRLGFRHAAARSSFECVRHKKRYEIDFSSAMRRRCQDYFLEKDYCAFLVIIF
jgi:hypothetical protein